MKVDTTKVAAALVIKLRRYQDSLTGKQTSEAQKRHLLRLQMVKALIEEDRKKRIND